VATTTAKSAFSPGRKPPKLANVKPVKTGPMRYSREKTAPEARPKEAGKPALEKTPAAVSPGPEERQALPQPSGKQQGTLKTPEEKRPEGGMEKVPPPGRPEAQPAKPQPKRQKKEKPKKEKPEER